MRTARTAGILAVVLVAVLAIVPSALAGSDITVVLHNDLNNRTSGGYPKVALDRLADRDCWLIQAGLAHARASARQVACQTI